MNTKESIDGVLLIDKASGMTSHDVVALVRKNLGIKKVGHCGTLDPLATGLLIITIGRGTKIQDLLMGEDKEYHGIMKLGVITDSHDADGKIMSTLPVSSFSSEQIEEAFAKYDGDFYQIPPMLSAIKQQGVALYKLARAGKIVERKPRLVHIYSHYIHHIDMTEIDFSVKCSKGFYVRTYAHDIGNVLGCGAHLSSLRREKSGKFDVNNALTITQLTTLSRASILDSLLSLVQVSHLRDY